MRPEDRDSAYLLDIALAARGAIQDLGDRDQAALERDEVLLLAIERRLIVLGEAARRVSGYLKRSHPEVTWRDAIGMRNILVHEYGDVDVGQVVRTVREDLPKLIAQLEPLLPPEPPTGGK